MKTYKHLLLFLLASIVFSCTADDQASTVKPVDETAGLVKIQEIANDTHVVELLSKNGLLTTGYHEVTIRIKEKNTGKYITDAAVDWLPVMHMAMMEHSCPKTAVAKVPETQTLYRGALIFQMPQNSSEFWDLTVNYSINGDHYVATAGLDVPASAKRNVNSFVGADGVRYIISYIVPDEPKVALNPMAVAVFRMDDMMHFSVANGFKVNIDPRMPGMGNHGSPNNTTLAQSKPGSVYEGLLSLTMTGYWKINLQLYNAAGALLKGEAVTSDNPASSIYFEVEF